MGKITEKFISTLCDATRPFALEKTHAYLSREQDKTIMWEQAPPLLSESVVIIPSEEDYRV